MRNLHSRRNDHDGQQDPADIAMADGTPITTLLDTFFVFAARKSFTANAIVKATRQWQSIPAFISLDAVIGHPSPLVYPGHFTCDARIRGKLVFDAVVKRTQTRSFTADAKKV